MKQKIYVFTKWLIKISDNRHRRIQGKRWKRFHRLRPDCTHKDIWGKSVLKITDSLKDEPLYYCRLCGDLFLESEVRGQ